MKTGRPKFPRAMFMKRKGITARNGCTIRKIIRISWLPIIILSPRISYAVFCLKKKKVAEIVNLGGKAVALYTDLVTPRGAGDVERHVREVVGGHVRIRVDDV